MQQIHCTGSPYTIGHTHGTAASAKVHRSIAFYGNFFTSTASLSWAQASQLASQTFAPVLRRRWPELWDELRGVADGAGVEIESVVALNVRTEIAFGMLKGDGEGDRWDQDGCTALAWRAGERSSWLAQNWDWREEQSRNLVCLTISREGRPRIKMVTEAGIVGKIGLNEEGVGVCLNAIRAAGVDAEMLPVHLGLRIVLESRNKEEAETRLREAGVASACTMVIADPSGGFALECSARGFRKIGMDGRGRVFHSNHFLVPQPGIVDTQSPRDTLDRIERIRELAEQVQGEPVWERLTKMFSDEKGFPASICRARRGNEDSSVSLFNIIMELGSRRAKVTVGRLVQPQETFWLEFSK